MTFLGSLLRCWGFVLTAPLAAALGILGALAGSAPAAIPTVRVPVPVPVLLPVLAVLVLSWTVHDRWPVVTTTAVRPRWQVAVARFLLTTATCCSAVAIGTAGVGDVEPVAVTAIGTSLVAVVAVVAGRRTWVLILVGGYLWLRHAVWLPVGSVVRHDLGLAAAAIAGAAAVLATAETLGPAWPDRYRRGLGPTISGGTMERCDSCGTKLREGTFTTATGRRLCASCGDRFVGSVVGVQTDDLATAIAIAGNDARPGRSNGVLAWIRTALGKGPA